MPDVRNIETVNAIAREYTSNGHNKSQALITVGYDETNAKSGKGLRVYDNPRVKKAIADIEAKTEEKQEKEQDRRNRMSDEDLQLAELMAKHRTHELSGDRPCKAEGRGNSAKMHNI